jgi:adenosylcobinamide-GDP ribazoletransferase
MDRLIAAIQFITALPVKKNVPFIPNRMIPCFPVVGLILGAGLVLFDGMAGTVLPRSAASLLDVILLIGLTGAFHIDGLGDTADGLYGDRPREKALAIMKDSRVGAMGLVAIWCGLTVKWAGIAGLSDHRPLLLLIIPAYARGAMLFGFRFLPYGRPEGTGRAFFDTPLRWTDFRWLLVPLFLSLFAGWRGVLINLSFLALTWGLLRFYRRRMGCITGDMLGAMCEITESVLFLAASATLAGGMP